MLRHVRKDGPTAIILHHAETGAMAVPEGHFDVATAYSFLHHLKDIRPTLAGIFRALRKGGCLYADLEPNGYFLKAVSALEDRSSYDPVIQREIDQVRRKDAEIANKLKLPTGTFQEAEFGKSLQGGFLEEELLDVLASIGFTTASIGYNWFLGQGTLVNDPALATSERKAIVTSTDRVLQRALPLSRPLYKYLSVHATK